MVLFGVGGRGVGCGGFILHRGGVGLCGVLLEGLVYREEDDLDQELVSRQDWEQSRLADNGEAL